MAPPKKQNAAAMEGSGNVENGVNTGGIDKPQGEWEDEEGMDMKARALTKLLQTSSVRLTMRYHC